MHYIIGEMVNDITRPVNAKCVSDVPGDHKGNHQLYANDEQEQEIHRFIQAVNMVQYIYKG